MKNQPTTGGGEVANMECVCHMPRHEEINTCKLKQGMFDCKITVFTPAYNRAHTIDRLYKSLTRQTFKNFEWVVIDDGSSDNTEQLINSYKLNKDFFTIKYLKQTRGGKHRAINNGLRLAGGELFFLVDSDDYIVDDALERIVFWESNIFDKQHYAGLSGLMNSENRKMIGTTFKGEYLDSTYIDQFRNGISGDHGYIFYTDLFRRYKYPEFDGEWHMAPTVSYVRMARDGYKLRYFNEVISIADYQDDGLTQMGDRKSLENFRGYTLRTKELIHSNISLIRKVELIGKYAYLGREKCLKYSEISNNIEVNIIFVFLWGLLAKLFFALHAHR